MALKLLPWCLLFFSVYLLIDIVLVRSELTGAKNDGIIRIPLQHMESGLEKLLRQGADLKLIEGLYEMSRRTPQPQPKPATVNGKPTPTNDTLPLFKYFDTNYYGIVNIGKPGKPFKMIMDTSWAYSWVISQDCPSTSLPCEIHNKYDHKRSSTYKPVTGNFNISSRYVGYFAQDVFLIGHMNCSDQVFAELTHLPWIYALYQTDGIMGLGFKELSPGVTPFFYNFLTQNKLKEPIFSFYINRDPTTPRGGSIFLGGIDTKHNKSEFHSIKVTSNNYWEFDMAKVTVVLSKKSKVEFCKNGCSAIADTSSNTIVGPAEEIKAINRLIGAERVFFSDRYLIPCINEYKGPKIKFTISNQEFQITGRDYIQKLSYSGITICLSAFQPASENMAKNTWTLGGAFLYQYYTAFNIVNRTIMIAEVA